MKKATLSIAMLFVATVLGSPSVAASPTDTDNVIDQVTHRSWGLIPIRTGFWDPEKTNRYRAPEKGEGFGLEKAKDKHNIDSINLIKFVLQYPGTITQSEDGTYGTAILFGAQIATMYCAPNPYNDVPLCGEPQGPFVVQVVAETAEIDYYYDRPASVNDDKAVGLITAFCKDYDGHCPDEVNDAINMGLLEVA